MAFSSEVATASPEGSASKQESKPGSDSIRTDQASGHPNAACQDRLREFGGSSMRDLIVAKQNKFHGTEIRQAVAAWDFGEARRDQTVCDNRNAESGECRRPQTAQAAAGANDAPGTAASLKLGKSDLTGNAGW
jgi:hypothetical protein